MFVFPPLHPVHKGEFSDQSSPEKDKEILMLLLCILETEKETLLKAFLLRDPKIRQEMCNLYKLSEQPCK